MIGLMLCPLFALAEPRRHRFKIHALATVISALPYKGAYRKLPVHYGGLLSDVKSRPLTPRARPIRPVQTDARVWGAHSNASHRRSHKHVAQYQGSRRLRGRGPPTARQAMSRIFILTTRRGLSATSSSTPAPGCRAGKC